MHWSSTFPCFWIMISTIFKKRWFSWQFWYFRSFSSAIKLKSKIIRLLLFVWKIIGENYILSWQVENKLLTTQHYMQNKNQTNDLILAIFSLKQAKCYGFVPKICIFGPIMGIWMIVNAKAGQKLRFKVARLLWKLTVSTILDKTFVDFFKI